MYKMDLYWHNIRYLYFIMELDLNPPPPSKKKIFNKTEEIQKVFGFCFLLNIIILMVLFVRQCDFAYFPLVLSHLFSKIIVWHTIHKY